MLKKHTTAERNALLREHWLRIRRQGKARFILREALGSFLIVAAAILGVELSESHTHPLSMQTVFFACAIMLPVCLLGAYLAGKWRWQDFEKRDPENKLPPWE
jgi:hypothetical protein